VLNRMLDLFRLGPSTKVRITGPASRRRQRAATVTATGGLYWLSGMLICTWRSFDHVEGRDVILRGMP
jgi:hypothetical protein